MTAMTKLNRTKWLAAELLCRGRSVTYHPKQTILTTDRDGPVFVFVLTGTIVEQGEDENRVVTLATYSQGDMLVANLTPEGDPSRLVALTESRVLKVDQGRYSDWMLGQTADIRELAVMTILAATQERLVAFKSTATGLAFGNTEDRVLSALQILASEIGEHEGDFVTVRAPQTKIAEMACCNRSSLPRALAVLKERHGIISEGKLYTLPVGLAHPAN